MRLQLNWIECQTTNLKVASSILAGRTIYREIAQLGSAPGLGPGGRRFESCFPDHEYFITQLCGYRYKLKDSLKILNYHMGLQLIWESTCFASRGQRVRSSSAPPFKYIDVYRFYRLATARLFFYFKFTINKRVYIFYNIVK